MKTAFGFVLAALALSSASAVSKNVSPVHKVIVLLQNLEGKISQEQSDAKATYVEYAEWCKDRGVELNHSMSLEETDLDHLQAMIDANMARLEEYNGAMEEAGAKTSTLEDLLKKAGFDYRVEKGTLEEKEKEMNEMIDALERTIHIMKKEALKKKEERANVVLAEISKAHSLADAFRVMVNADMMQTEDAAKLTALLQSSGQEQANEFDEQLSGNQNLKVLETSAIDMLDDLLQKAKKDLDDIRLQLQALKQNYEKKVQAIENEMALEKVNMNKAKKGYGLAGEQKGQEESDLATTKETLNADQASYLQVQNDCYKAQIDYTEKARSRAQEIEALKTAMEAMQKATAADKVVQSRKAESFLQMSTHEKNDEYEAVKFVRSLAHEQHSEALAQLAGRMASAVRYGANAGSDPFEKVLGLLKQMLSKLEKEAESEATHKDYCDKELKSTNDKTEDKSDQADELATLIDQLNARLVETTDVIADMNKDLKELIATQAEMDSIRSKEKAIFSKGKKEMDEGLDGVKIALRILRGYYQDVETQINEKHGMDHQGGHAVIGFLEVIESDFSKTVAQMIATENTAKANYEKTTKENVLLRKQKEIDLRWQQSEAKDMGAKLAETKSSKDSVASELDALTEYKAKLDEMCTAKVDPFEVRQARRQAEIDGLKKGLDILNGEGEMLSLNSKRAENAKLTGIYSNFLQRGRVSLRHARK